MKKVGLWLAIAALLVNGPRFVLVFLRVDNIDIPLEAEAVMLGATGVATGLVLTGGGAYIAHSLAESRARGMVQTVMLLCWFLLLLFSVILLAPLMVAAIGVSPLKTVLSSSISQWLWSITAVLAVEIISAGAMAAYALEGQKGNESQRETQNNALSTLTTALVRRIENSIAPQPALVVPPSPTTTPHENGSQSRISQEPRSKKDENGFSDTEHIETSVIEMNGKYSKSERQRLLLEQLQHVKQEGDVQVGELAQELHVSRQTIYRDLADLKSRQLLQF